jgi:REP element-mobilizing transposase RayT
MKNNFINNNVGAGSSRPNIKQINKTKIGEEVENEIRNLPNKYKNIKCNEYVIMPNHFHCIIEIKIVGAESISAQI